MSTVFLALKQLGAMISAPAVEPVVELVIEQRWLSWSLSRVAVGVEAS